MRLDRTISSCTKNKGHQELFTQNSLVPKKCFFLPWERRCSSGMSAWYTANSIYRAVQIVLWCLGFLRQVKAIIYATRTPIQHVRQLSIAEYCLNSYYAFRRYGNCRFGIEISTVFFICFIFRFDNQLSHRVCLMSRRSHE
jgi:hypothetical protein